MWRAVTRCAYGARRRTSERRSVRPPRDKALPKLSPLRVIGTLPVVRPDEGEIEFRRAKRNSHGGPSGCSRMVATPGLREVGMTAEISCSET
eukprot:5813164-Prymnesium_polylepis.1